MIFRANVKGAFIKHYYFLSLYIYDFNTYTHQALGYTLLQLGLTHFYLQNFMA